MVKLLLNKQRSKNSFNIENNIKINIKNKTNILPLEEINERVNSYEQYISEKTSSQKYRLSFNITPICSNVLFNNISEIVYHEGGDDCLVFGSNGISGATDNITESIKDYCFYKDINAESLTRHDLINDTAYSHPRIGGVVYHCGYDIFNNHTLRKKEFNIVNKIDKKNSSKKYFNTIRDYSRDFNGNTIMEHMLDLSTDNKTFQKHLYQVDNILTFEESINENLIEKDGWVGFINPTNLNIVNYNNNDISISIGKCMNNNKSCEMIDMYPDRSLYSFIPKINKYRNNREEKNWDYCLTYPYENFYNELVEHVCEDGVKINGITCEVLDNIFEIDNNEEYIDWEDGTLITLKTNIKNNFKINSVLNIVLIGDINGNESIIRLDNNQKIIGLGNNDREHIFKIYGDELIESLNKFTYPSKVQIRVRKVIDGGLCTYYFRKFKRIPNFKNTDVYNDGLIDKNEINTYSKRDFNSSINGMGFSRTIYNDRNAQLLFNDDIELRGLRDNLGRELSEIYLTIVKNNKGNKEWYDDKDFTSPNITFSRCFGKVTSGIDINDDKIFDYNIHKIHNVSADLINNSDFWDSPEYESAFNDYKRFYIPIRDGNKTTYVSPKALESDISIMGNVNDSTFLGDIIEFNKNKLIETSLEIVYHRFNTRQREILDNEYNTIVYDDLISDDYDLGGDGFNVVTRIYNQLYSNLNIPINIAPEGYYYKPHYKIQLKEYKDKINQGRHTLLSIASFNKGGDNIYDMTLSKNYFLEPMEKIYLYNKNNGRKVIGTVISVSGKYCTNILIFAELNGEEKIEDFIFYKHNTEKPDTAYELNDGSGVYLWKDFKEEHEYDINNVISNYVFTNNAHYIHQNIIFSLHRQDPVGNFSLNNSSSTIPIVANLSINGDTNDYSGIETYIDELEENLQC